MPNKTPVYVNIKEEYAQQIRDLLSSLCLSATEEPVKDRIGVIDFRLVVEREVGEKLLQAIPVEACADIAYVGGQPSKKTP